MRLFKELFMNIDSPLTPLFWPCLAIGIVWVYCHFFTVEDWDGKTFDEIVLFKDPRIRQESTRKAFEMHSKPINVRVFFPDGRHEDLHLIPHSTIYVNEYPKLKMDQFCPLLSGCTENMILCENWDLRVGGVIIERYDPIVTGISRYEIK